MYVEDLLKGSARGNIKTSTQCTKSVQKPLYSQQVLYPRSRQRSGALLGKTMWSKLSSIVKIRDDRYYRVSITIGLLIYFHYQKAVFFFPFNLYLVDFNLHTNSMTASCPGTVLKLYVVHITVL